MYHVQPFVWLLSMPCHAKYQMSNAVLWWNFPWGLDPLPLCGKLLRFFLNIFFSFLIGSAAFKTCFVWYGYFSYFTLTLSFKLTKFAGEIFTSLYKFGYCLNVWMFECMYVRPSVRLSVTLSPLQYLPKYLTDQRQKALQTRWSKALGRKFRNVHFYI